MRAGIVIFSTIFTLVSPTLLCQENYKDTLKISLQQADSVFITKNLSLLAEKCNVEAARAQIVQAKLFQNPSITLNQNVYNTEYQTNGARRWFDMSGKGETSIEVEKLFLLAGKRNKQIQLAELSADKEGHVYYDLVRTLKYSLHSCFYELYAYNRIIKVYDHETDALNKLIKVSEEQFSKQYISKRELLRLKSELFSLENEKLDYKSQLIERLSDINLLLHTQGIYYLPEADMSVCDKFTPPTLRLQALIDTALVSRYDLKMARADLAISHMNVDYQKSLAVPDLTISGGWDRNGSFIHDYNYLGLQTSLPLFNRNQGNIRSAKFMEESSKYKLESAEEQVKTDVINAYTNALETNRLYSSFDKTFVNDLDRMNDEMLRSFEKKNIGLIEFIDYYDAYKDNQVQYNKLLLNMVSSIENINYTVGKEIIR